MEGCEGVGVGVGGGVERCVEEGWRGGRNTAQYIPQQGSTAPYRY